MGGRGEFEESAILAQHEPLALRERVVLAPQWIGREPGAVLFIGGEALNGIDTIGEGRRSFMRREIADEIAAATRNCLPPVTCIPFKLGFLARIDVVPNDAGDHALLQLRCNGLPCRAFMTCLRPVMLRP